MVIECQELYEVEFQNMSSQAGTETLEVDLWRWLPFQTCFGAGFLRGNWALPIRKTPEVITWKGMVQRLSATPSRGVGVSEKGWDRW